MVTVSLRALMVLQLGAYIFGPENGLKRQFPSENFYEKK
jgi:hypothetical protein